MLRSAALSARCADRRMSLIRRISTSLSLFRDSVAARRRRYIRARDISRISAVVSPVGLSPSSAIMAFVCSRKSRRLRAISSLREASRLMAAGESCCSSGRPASRIRRLISSRIWTCVRRFSRSISSSGLRMLSGSKSTLRTRPRVGLSIVTPLRVVSSHPERWHDLPPHPDPGRSVQR